VKAAGSARAGTAAAVLAFLLWGLFPLYWKMLAGVPAVEVVAHRTAWGFVAVAAWVTLRGRWKDARAVASRPGTIARLAGSAVLIAVNWLLYVWAVVHDHVVEASLGYFINPLVNVLLGVLVLGERLSRAQRVAVALAAAGVAVLTVGHGRLPWIALALAFSFGLYGLARKTVGADAVVGLLWETGLLAPLAAAWLVSLEARGSAPFLGSDGSFLQIISLGDAMVPLGNGFFLLGRGQAGVTLENEPLQSLPPSLRFFAGGDNNLRGYAYQSLGPKNPSGQVVGGKNLLVGTLEFEKAFSPTWGLAAFYDAGNAFDDFSQFQLKQNAGLGLRIYTPVGPIRLDLARQIGETDNQYRISLSIGFAL